MKLKLCLTCGSVHSSVPFGIQVCRVHHFEHGARPGSSTTVWNLCASYGKRSLVAECCRWTPCNKDSSLQQVWRCTIHSETCTYDQEMLSEVFVVRVARFMYYRIMNRIPLFSNLSNTGDCCSRPLRRRAHPVEHAGSATPWGRDFQILLRDLHRTPRITHYAPTYCAPFAE